MQQEERKGSRVAIGHLRHARQPSFLVCRPPTGPPFLIPPIRLRPFVTAAILAISIVCIGTKSAVRAGAAEWPDEYQAGSFMCHADFALAEYRGLLNSLPRLQRDLVTQLGIGASQEPIHLFLFRKKSTYQAYLKQYFPKVPSRKALFIKGRGPGMVFAYRGEDFETDVRHECTHALLNASLPMVPLWLDEGLAEYFEVPASQRANESPHMTYVRLGVRLAQIPKLEGLEKLSDLSQMNSGKYRNAWAWVHFMLHGPREAHEVLSQYLADIQAMTPPGQLSRRLRHRMPKLEQRFAEHFKSWKSSGFLSL